MRQTGTLNITERIGASVPFKPAKREMHRFEVGGKELQYDVNAMTLTAAGGRADNEAPSCFRPDFPHPGIRDHVDYLVLYLTRRCNLRCEYCFVRNLSDDPRARMTPDTARRALELLLPAGRPVTIAFFGGEPLLEWDLITEVTEFAKHIYRGPGRPQFHITTNGALMDAEKVAFLDREGFSMIVSLDGPSDMHNNSRPGAKGMDSYEATLRGLKLLRGRRLPTRTTLRATFSAREIKLRERLEHHHRLIDEGLCAHVTLEPVSLTESSCRALPSDHELSFDAPSVDWRAVEREYEQAARYLRDRIRGRRRASFEQIVRFVRRLAYHQAACSECEAGNGYASVAPDGTIHACHREGPSRIGNLAAGGLDESLRAKWLDNRFYLNAKCLECPIRLVCGGPCRQDGLERGEIHTPPEADCKLRHIWFRWAAWLLSELSRDEVARLTGQRASTCCGQKG